MTKILGLTPFPIIPATFGGAERCLNLLSAVDDIDVLALDWSATHEYESQIGTMRYEVVPADSKAVDRANKLIGHGVKTFDPMPSLVANDLTTIRKKIDNIDPDLVILEHPWLLDLIGDRPYILDSHNCETWNTMQQSGVNSYDYDLVLDIEQRAVNGAEHMTYCWTDDLDHMGRFFQVQPPLTLIRNGTAKQHITSKGTSKNLIFIGSAYPPNVKAAQRLVNLASALSDYTIQIIGACSNYVEAPYPNVQLHGQVSEKTLNQLLIDAYAFINLVSEGSGTHLKIAKAMSYGLPVLTTPTGSRGYRNTIHVQPSTVASKLKTLDWAYQSKASLDEAATLHWDVIAKQFANVIKRHS